MSEIIGNFGFQPLLPWWLLVIAFLPLLGICIWLIISRKTQRWDWLRRTLMLLLLLVVALRPVTTEDAVSSERLNANVLFVVDRTGSMNAEDYNSNLPRIDGVKTDAQQIMNLTEGSRYGILTFDSVATTELPFTTDLGAVYAWMDTLETEPTAYSTGSNISRVRAPLTELVQRTKEEDPESYLFVYIMTDGENTDGLETETFAEIRPYVDGGAVLGYGTELGGRMKIRGGADDGEYVQDPAGGDGISRMDPVTLQQIAQETGLEFQVRNTDHTSLSSTLNGLELTTVSDTEGMAQPRHVDWYWVAAILLSLVASWELAIQTLRLNRKVDLESLKRGLRNNEN